jgi:hypothetical protein
MTSRPVVFLSQIFCLTILFLGLNCHHSTEPPPPPSGPDTTSHDFTWTTYAFGEGSSSVLRDVAIINDTLAYAVGEIYLKDSVGQLDPFPYVCAIWNGRDWLLSKVTGSAFRAVLAFAPNDIWAATSAPYHWNGQIWKGFNVTGVFNGYACKLWGVAGSDLYMVGTNGSISHFDGVTWQKIESGTTVDLWDVWGTSDGKVLWTCGYTNDYSQSVLLRINSQTVQLAWSRQGKTTQPYGDLLTSLWGKDHLFLTSNYGVYRQSMSDTSGVRQLFSPTSFPFRIRGSAENNIAVAGDEGRIWHYNGATWKLLYDSPGVALYSIAVTTSMIIAVGSDFNVFPPKAVIYRAVRMH